MGAALAGCDGGEGQTQAPSHQVDRGARDRAGEYWRSLTDDQRALLAEEWAASGVTVGQTLNGNKFTHLSADPGELVDATNAYYEDSARREVSINETFVKMALQLRKRNGRSDTGPASGL